MAAPVTGSKPRRGWLVAVVAIVLVAAPLAVWFFGFRSVAPKPPPPKRAFPTIVFGHGVETDAEEDASVEAAPTPQPSADAVPENRILGTVVDEEDKPVKGAVVGCSDRPENIIAAYTNEAGRFLLPLDLEGCKIVARHFEHGASREERVYKNRKNELHLRAGGAIEGVVVDERGLPVRAYTIGIESFVSSDVLEPPPRPRDTIQVSAMNGAFTFERLAPGRYVLAASAAGRPPVNADPIDVESGRRTRNVKIVLPAGGRLTGRVVDAETQKPLGGATVELDAVTDSSANAIEAVKTDTQGLFTIDGAPPGPFSIRVVHSAYRSRIVPGLTTGGGAPSHVEVALTPAGDGGERTEMSGVGLRIATSANGLRIAGVEEDGPASEAGLQAGDEISKIDGIDVHGLTMSEATQRLRGAAGSTVVVTVDRDGTPTDITITREELVTGGR